MILEPEIETLPWPEQQQRLDEPPIAGRSSIYSLSRRSTVRSWAGRVSTTPQQTGGLADIAQLPTTEKDELRATRNDEHPIGTHLAVPMDRVARIYSTSGTTGIPSYIPLTAGDIDNWVTTSSRSYAASGLGPGARIVTTYGAGPFVAGAALDALQPAVDVSYPGGQRQYRAADDGGPPAEGAGNCLHAVICIASR